MGDVKDLAARFSALGHEARLQIVRQLLAHHPRGLVVGEMQRTLGIPGSTLSHHLDALHHERLITKEREGRFLRYRAEGEVLRGLLDFLYAECCQAGEEGGGADRQAGGLVTLGLRGRLGDSIARGESVPSAKTDSAANASASADEPQDEGAPDGEIAWRAW